MPAWAPIPDNLSLMLAAVRVRMFKTASLPQHSQNQLHCIWCAAALQVRVQDNVRAQHKLVTEKLGIQKLVMVIGWSMGAGQTFQWGVRYSSHLDSQA